MAAPLTVLPPPSENPGYVPGEQIPTPPPYLHHLVLPRFLSILQFKRTSNQAGITLYAKICI